MRRVRWYWAAAIATGGAFLNILQTETVSRRAGEAAIGWRLVVGQAADWYMWLALLPLVLLVVRRAARKQRMLGVLAIHVFAGLPIVLSQITLTAILGTTLGFLNMAGGFWSILTFNYGLLLPWEITVYVLIAAVLHALFYFEQVELQYAKLAGVEQERRRSIEVLAGTAAHDFNNLLAVIGGNAQMLRQADPEERGPLVQEIRRGTERAAVVARHLLSLSKGLRVLPARVDLTSLVRQLDTSLADRVAPQALRIESPDRRVETIADAELLRFVLVNLVHAVGEDAPPDAPVHIELAPPLDGIATIRVSGGGPHLDAESLTHIFEPGASTRRVGHGLGLAAARSIIERNGGSIDATNDPERGTTLTVTLPLAPPALLEADDEARVAPGAAS